MKCQTNQFNCPVEATLSLIGGKYKPLILWHLIDRPLHYMELQRLLPNATPKMLSQQLHDLESSGLIDREVIPEKPPKTIYSLTQFGQSIVPILDAMCQWGNSYLDGLDVQPPCCQSQKKMLGVAVFHQLCPAHISCSKSVTVGHNCIMRQSQHGDS